MANDEDAAQGSELTLDASNSAPANFDIGYGRPPRHTRFKKGRSGNPKGRPKGSKNLTTYIDKELQEKITIVENGIRKRVPKKHAIAKQLVNKAASGDPKMVPLLLSREQSAANQAGIGPAEAPMTREDEQVLEALIDRIRRSEPHARTDTNPQSATPSAEPPSTEATPSAATEDDAGHLQ